MAELDYAFLADYAQIEGGKISALGASYTHAVVSELPAPWMTTVAGRIRAVQGEGAVPLAIRIDAPDNAYVMNVEGVIAAGPDVRAYDGKVGLLFTFTVHMPLVAEGLYEVLVFIADKQVRRLAFVVELVAP